MCISNFIRAIPLRQKLSNTLFTFLYSWWQLVVDNMTISPMLKCGLVQFRVLCGAGIVRL